MYEISLIEIKNIRESRKYCNSMFHEALKERRQINGLCNQEMKACRWKPIAAEIPFYRRFIYGISRPSRRALLGEPVEETQ